MNFKIIKKLRRDQGISQGVLALSSGLSQAYLSKIERGHRRPGWEALESLATGLGMSLDDLVKQCLE